MDSPLSNDQSKSTLQHRYVHETRIDLADGRHFSPDAICSFCKSDGEASIFCLEVYNGDRVKYATEQLEKLFGLLI